MRHKILLKAPALSLKVKVGEGKPDMPDVDMPVSTTYPLDKKVVYTKQ